MKEPAKGGGQTTLQELSQLYYLRREVAVLERRLQEEAGGEGEARLRERLERRRRAAARESVRLEAYIAGIGDSRLRQMFERRFRNGESWEQVAAALGISEAAAKKAVYRHIHKKAL